MPQRKDLDILFNQAPESTASLDLRLNWLADILNWILSDTKLRTEDAYFRSGETQALRLKWVLHVLERRPEWQKQVRAILSTLPQETQIFDLLVMTGLHQQSGLFSEILERLQKEFLPTPKDEANLQFFFRFAFRQPSDAISFLRTQSENFESVVDLFSTQADSFQSWQSQFNDACLYLSIQISGLGLDTEIRRRLKVDKIEDVCFYKIHAQALSWKQSLYDPVLSREASHKMLDLIRICRQEITNAYQQMDTHGVSVAMVYRLDRIESLLKRLELLMNYNLKPDSGHAQKLISSLIFESVRSRQISALLDDNTSLIAKKIVENSAEAGEHYIARTKKDYFVMLKRALGGGLVTAVTVLVKLSLAILPASPFVGGLLSSFNYSISFLLIQMKGFTLATKQPAMTAAALASKIKPSEKESLNPLVQEIIFLLRTQVVAVLGNVIAVVPALSLFAILWASLFKNSFLTASKASEILNDFSVLGPTPFYAAITGVLLFASSLISGWFYNWVLYRRLHLAIGQSQRLRRFFGSARMDKFSHFFKINSASLAANISLGFLLGLVPVFAEFFGFPVDVRHVTLSSGLATVAFWALPHQAIEAYTVWTVLLGILSMAALNILVSFGLALLVAFRAQKIPAHQGFSVLKEILFNLLKNPRLFFWPPKK